MTNTLDNKEGQEEHNAQLFDVADAYREKLLPLIEMLAEACELIGVNYLMSFCAAHVHDEEGCHYTCGVFCDMEPERVPMQAQAAAHCLRMGDTEIIILEQVINSIYPVIEQMKKEADAHLN
jgi:hypothetical protein